MMHRRAKPDFSNLAKSALAGAWTNRCCARPIQHAVHHCIHGHRMACLVGKWIVKRN
jgi:hypothetical protein